MSENLSEVSDKLVKLINPFTQATILAACLIMIIGGLLVFYFRLKDQKQKWRLEYNQVIGTIFFFPTLIVLAIYLQLSKDAVIAILGAFLGSLFTKAVGQGTPVPEDNTPPEPEPAAPRRANPTAL